MNLENILEILSDNESPSITMDSRKVCRGCVFVAIRGTNVNGHKFIEKAIANGASYIVHSEPLTAPQKAAVSRASAAAVMVEDSSAALGKIAQAKFDNPAKKLTCLTVTGTNGKTTTAYMVRAIMNRAKRKCGMISTVCCDVCSPAGTIVSSMTTPDQITIAQLMSQMLKNGGDCVMTESSSHAIEQNRIAGIDFTAAAFTNLTGDHLDYHKTMENYLRAKTKLFENLSRDATAVLNAESQQSSYIAQRTPAQVVWYSTSDMAGCTGEGIAAENIKLLPNKTVYTLSIAGAKIHIETPLIGLHNVSNQLAAAGLCLAAGLNADGIAEGISSIGYIPGRLERIDCGQDFTVLVDYAHTDDALKNVLTSLKSLPHRNLIVLFGCGGDRDRTKRPRMAAVAAKFADMVIITSDNPRTESPQQIIDDITAGLPASSQPETIIQPDRKAAIEMAVNRAGTDDILLIAGKGHEDYQIIGTAKIHFDDRETASECLGAL